MKKRITVYLNNTMYEELKKQAKALGFSLSSYVVYLLLLVDRRR